MNLELKILRGLTNNFPDIPGFGRLSTYIARFYSRKEREKVVVKALNHKLKIDPNQPMESGLLFHPQLFDKEELTYLEKNLNPGDTFIDLGANIGYYTLRAASAVGETGTVICVEADPVVFERLSENVSLNQCKNVLNYNLGVSDKTEVLSFGINNTHRGGNSFLHKGESSINVQCYSLLNILNKSNVKSLEGMKIDIEGYEFKVLKKFFEEADRSLFPKFIITEYHDSWEEKMGGSTIDLIVDNGYSIVYENSLNYILRNSG